MIFSKASLALLLAAAFWVVPGRAAAQPSRYNNQNSLALKQVQDTLVAINHSLNNHEAELHQMEERFASIETIVDGLRRQMNDQSKGHKEQLLNSKLSLEGKVGELELVSKGIVQDLQLLKSHINESSAIFSQYKQQFSNLEKQMLVQNQNIESLQTAMKALMDAFQTSEPEAVNLYQVKSGDSLEKIALNHGTSIKAIKELNGLTGDRIRIGQKLKLPTK